MITNEQLAQRPMSVELVPMEDVAEPDRFGVLFRFPCGLNEVWSFKAPAVPIDDDFVRHAMRAVLEAIVADLREGRSEPRIKRNKQAFRDFERHSSSITGALHALIVQWAQKRLERVRDMAKPVSTIQ
jgi:hypothetical protein